MLRGSYLVWSLSMTTPGLSYLYSASKPMKPIGRSRARSAIARDPAAVSTYVVLPAWYDGQRGKAMARGVGGISLSTWASREGQPASKCMQPTGRFPSGRLLSSRWFVSGPPVLVVPDGPLADLEP